MRELDRREKLDVANAQQSPHQQFILNDVEIVDLQTCLCCQLDDCIFRSSSRCHSYQSAAAVM